MTTLCSLLHLLSRQNQLLPLSPSLRSTSVQETCLPCNLLLISSQMLSCQLKGNLKLSLTVSLLHQPSVTITGYTTTTLPSPATVTPVPPFIQVVAYIYVLTTQIFSDQSLKSMDIIQLLICTAGLCLYCCSVLSPSFPKQYFASLPPNYFLVGGSSENSYPQKLFSQPVFLNSSSPSASPAPVAPLLSGHPRSCFLPTTSPSGLPPSSTQCQPSSLPQLLIFKPTVLFFKKQSFTAKPLK